MQGTEKARLVVAPMRGKGTVSADKVAGNGAQRHIAGGNESSGSPRVQEARMMGERTALCMVVGRYLVAPTALTLGARGSHFGLGRGSSRKGEAGACGGPRF